MCLGMFMAILDIQVVATSLPAIQHALAISPDAMSWIQYGRTSGHAEAIRQRLIAGDITAAQAIGLDRIPTDLSVARSMIEQAAFATSVNEAWAMLAAVALLGLLIIPLARSQRHAADG